ncbi:MAG: PLDc N-terminal domain-containing protein [Clostridia bacterium]|nr:PLDc N-terminal domain-containing protein [Clostridia bacterium]
MQDISGISAYLPLFIPIVLIQFGLQIAAIVNLIKRKKVRFNNKAIWAIIILLGGLVGPIIYFAARGDEY